MTEIFYPVSRLLANPKIFYAIANALDGPDGELLRTIFYDLIEYNFTEVEDPEECEFEANEICFSIDPEDKTVQITLDTGLASVLKPAEGEIRAEIKNDSQMAATSAIYDRIVTALVECNPEFDGNIALCSPPTPRNGYLRSADGECFQGSFHLLTDPDRTFAFHVHIVDVQRDIFIARYKPL